MSKTKLTALCGVLALVGAGFAHAGTLEDIAQKNRELQVLKADVEIAKKKSELKQAIEGKAEGGPVAVSAAPGTPGLPAPAKRVAKSSDGVDAEIAVKSVSGDVGNPTVEFTVDGEDVPSVTKGGSITRGWKLASVNGRTVVMKGPKGQTKTLYLPTGTTSAGVTRYDAPGAGTGAPGAVMPTMPNMPNMSGMSMPPLPGAGLGGYRH